MKGGTYNTGFTLYFLPVLTEMRLSRAATSLPFSLARLESRVEAVAGEFGVAGDARFATMADRAANRDELTRVLRPIWRQRVTHEWVERLTALGVPVGPVASLGDALGSDLVAEREMVVEVAIDDGGVVRTVGNPVKVDGVTTSYTGPPGLGEHTDELRGAVR